MGHYPSGFLFVLAMEYKYASHCSRAGDIWVLNVMVTPEAPTFRVRHIVMLYRGGSHIMIGDVVATQTIDRLAI